MTRAVHGAPKHVKCVTCPQSLCCGETATSTAADTRTGCPQNPRRRRLTSGFYQHTRGSRASPLALRQVLCLGAMTKQLLPQLKTSINDTTNNKQLQDLALAVKRGQTEKSSRRGEVVTGTQIVSLVIYETKHRTEV